MKSATYDVIVIGGGSAGVAAADAAHAAGARVCIVEASKIGGECPYWGCVPTKAMIRAAKLYHEMRTQAGRFGVRAQRVTLDVSTMMARKDAAVNVITGNGRGLEKSFAAAGIDVVRGRAKFVSRTTIAVGQRRLRAKAFVLATGSKDIVPNIDGLEHADVWTSRDAVSLTRLPSSIAIIGAGPVGCEFATFFSMCGVKTIVTTDGAQVLSREDAEIAAIAHANLAAHGAVIVPDTRVLAVKREGKRIKLTMQTGHESRRTLTVDRVLLATGKRPNIDGLALEKAGVDWEEGWLRIDDRLRLAPHIFAAGDAIGRSQFTSTANASGAIAGWNAAQSGRTLRRMNFDIVPHVTFVAPELASVGLTAEAAVEEGYSIAIRRFPIGALGRAVVDGHREGMLKVVLEKRSGLVLGASVIGERAGEIIHELALAMHANIPFDVVQSMLHAYPTYSEAIPAAA